MADAKNEAQETTEPAAKGGGKGGKIALVLVLVVGLGAGGFIGSSLLGDSVGPILAARAQAAEAGGGGRGGGGRHGGGEAPSAIHVVDNLVVNPARSGGTRFLLTSIAVEATSPSLLETVRAHDVEVRAALILVLGSRTTEELSEIENRASIVAAIAEAIEEILGHDVVKQVFIPQFVIQ
jgi:flagellar FliL protein